MAFKDRTEAGKILARKLQKYADRPDLLVLALPRGGVPVAYEIALALDCPLDLFIVRKLGVPGHEELAMGAIASGGFRVLNQDIVEQLSIPEWEVEAVAQREMQEMERRENTYRGSRPAVPISSRCVILVDDGLATGSTMLAAIRAVRAQKPSRIVVAVPVAPPDTCEAIRKEADDVICAETPVMFVAVGLWYRDFAQTSDEEVKHLFEEAARRSERKVQ